MKTLLLSIIGIAFFLPTFGQVDSKLMQFPDISETHITFSYGDDIWIASKSGGVASRLSSPDGSEIYPRFSPDGSMIAYTANYQGNNDVYIISVNGGIPKRLTYHGFFDRVLGWTPDGKSVLFSSSRESGRQRYSQFYTVSINGGAPKKLDIPYGEFGSFSNDGNKFAYTDRSRVNRNWKRYRGGTAPDITIFNLKTFQTENITNNDANDELPMWIGNSIYYMSDNGPNKRNNLWKYDFNTKKNTQLTNFEDYDITFPENSKEDIVFEAGGKLYVYNLASYSTKEVTIQVVSDYTELISVQKNVESYLTNATISPDGKRVVAEARGELFNLPATKGFSTNLSNTSGFAERSPAWSPDGKHVAYWSDAQGEYQLLLHDIITSSPPKTITNFKSGFKYEIYWSPDSKKIAFIDQTMDINCLDISTGKVTKADKAKYMFHGGLSNFQISWSPDSQWFTYSRGTDNRATNAIFIYNVSKNKLSQLTSGYYSDLSPVFSADGKHLFFRTNRTFLPLYSSLDNTFIYPNATNIAVGTLNATETSLLEIENDDFKIENKKNKDAEDTSDKKKKEKPEAIKEITIDINGFEQRVEHLNIEPGNIGRLQAIDDKLLFVRYPNSGSERSKKAALNYYDFKEREVKTIINDVRSYSVSANGKKALIYKDGKLAVIDIKEKQKIDKTVPTSQMIMTIVPKKEWQQIFNDVWRFERDYFYDPNMHGVDWNEMRKRYGVLIEQASSRNDVNIIIGDLIAELNASHTYTGGGDTINANRLNVGYLGADIVVENSSYKIKKIINGAPWDTEVRSPLNKPGITVKEGDYILAVNGIKIDISKPLSAAFQGLANSTVQLTVSKTTSFQNSEKIIVKLLSSETRLRHLAWIENNRKKVDKLTDGKVGYIYVRSTGVDGQNELIRQFYAQMDKEGLIIDERFNSGGQIPDRFIELLDRDPLAYWAVRDGKDWAWPPAGSYAAKVMLINGFSGSGGDAFPDYFRKRGLGPLIGTRTWGGLIGISGAPRLIDNGGITVPTFRMYDPSGEWFKEGHGVDPDIKVVEDFGSLAKGNDKQLKAGIDEVLKLLKTNKAHKKPKRPEYEKR